MRRPLATVVVAYGLGLLLALCPLTVAVLLFLLVPAAFVLKLRIRPAAGTPFPFRRLLLWLVLALLGWANATVRNDVVVSNDLRRMLGQEPALVTVRGTLSETPKLKISQRQGQETWRSVARVRVRELRRNQAWEPATGEVLVTTPEVLGTAFFSRQPVAVAGVIALPPAPLAEGLFDYRQYLAGRGIYFLLRTESTNDWILLDSHRTVPPLTDRFLAWSRQTLALGLPVEDEPLRLLWAMTLGWRTAFTGDISEPFLEAGTQHMFAIDGLRIALVSGMIVTLLRLLRLSRAWCGLIAVPAIWFYTAATGWDASAVRASVMMTIILGGWALKRPEDLLNSLAAAAFIILLADPRQLFQTGFLLSFFVMLVIALLLPPLNGFCDRWLDRLLKPDPLLPDELVPGWRKRLLAWSRRLAHFCALSFAAWLGCLPLAAKFFHLFSPVSTLANLFAVPLGSLALTANLGALICGHWLPWFTVLFNHAAWFLMSAMTWVSVQAARLPGAFFYVPEPSVPTIAIYYAVIIAAASGWFAGRRRKIIGTIILLLIAADYGWRWQSSLAETDLTVLPLDGGHAVHVDAASRSHDWLIDCGSEPAVNFTVKDFLHAHGVNSLPRLALTDASARNCGGAPRLDDIFHVGELWTSPVAFRSAAGRAAVARFETNATPAEPAGRHHLFHWGDTNGCWRVLYPAVSGNVARTGDAALVLRGDLQGSRVLLLSDLSRAGQSELLSQTNDLRAEVVVTGLPDDGDPLCDALIDAIRPRAIVVADASYPATRRAGRALKERLSRMQIPVFYTRTAGAVTITTRPAGWRLRTMDGQTLQGKPGGD